MAKSTSRERGFFTNKEYEEHMDLDSSIVEPIVTDNSSFREGSRSLAPQEYNYTPSLSVTNYFGNTGVWMSAQETIENFEYEIGCDIPELSDKIRESWSEPPTGMKVAFIHRFPNIAPTEIDSIFRFTIPGPAVLIVRVYAPQSFKLTPEGLSKVRFDYTLYKCPHRIHLRLKRTTDAELKNSGSNDLGLHKLTI